MIISTMYRRREQAGRIGMVYICNGAAMAVGGLIGYAIGHMQGANGLSGWQW
jgi:MFS family permease